LEERLPRWAGAVAERDAEMNMSAGAPASIALASAFEPPDIAGATGIPVAFEKPAKRAVVSVAYASAEYESTGERATDVDVVVIVDVETEIGPVTVAVVVVAGSKIVEVEVAEETVITS
jgi:hypothetical protein